MIRVSQILKEELLEPELAVFEEAEHEDEETDYEARWALEKQYDDPIPTDVVCRHNNRLQRARRRYFGDRND